MSSLKKRILKKLVPINREEFMIKTLPVMGALFIFNLLILLTYSFWDLGLQIEKLYIALVAMILVNLISSIYLYFYTIKRLLYLNHGEKRLFSSFSIMAFSTFVPIAGVFILYYCFREYDKKTFTTLALFKRISAIPALILLITLSLPSLRQSSLLKMQMSPEGFYATKSLEDSFYVFNLKAKSENCSDNCIVKAFKNKEGAMTITGIILGVAVDALAIFKEKESGQKNPIQKKKANEIATLKLLGNNLFFLEKSCDGRSKPFDGLKHSPYHLMTGSTVAAASMLYDIVVYSRFQEVSKKRLLEIANSAQKKKQFNQRKIASIKESLRKPSCL